MATNSDGTKSAVASIASATTDGAVVTAVTGKKIRVHRLALTQGTSAAGITFNTKPGGAGSAISPTWVPAASSPFVLDYSPGWFETNAGEGLTCTTGATTSAVAILVVYSLVTP